MATSRQWRNVSCDILPSLPVVPRQDSRSHHEKREIGRQSPGAFERIPITPPGHPQRLHESSQRKRSESFDQHRRRHSYSGIKDVPDSHWVSLQPCNPEPEPEPEPEPKQDNPKKEAREQKQKKQAKVTKRHKQTSRWKVWKRLRGRRRQRAQNPHKLEEVTVEPKVLLPELAELQRTCGAILQSVQQGKDEHLYSALEATVVGVEQIKSTLSKLSTALDVEVGTPVVPVVQHHSEELQKMQLTCKETQEAVGLPKQQPLAASISQLVQVVSNVDRICRELLRTREIPGSLELQMSEVHTTVKETHQCCNHLDLILHRGGDSQPPLYNLLCTTVQDLQQMKHEMHQIVDQYQKSNDRELRSLKSQITQLQHDVSTKEAQLSAKEKVMKESESKLKKKEEQVKEKQNEIARFKQQNKIQMDRTVQLENEVDRISKDKEKNHERFLELQSQLAEKKQDNTSLMKEVQQLRATLSGDREERRSKDRRCLELEVKLDKKEQLVTCLQNEAHQMNAKLNSRVEELERRCMDLQSQLTQKDKTITWYQADSKRQMESHLVSLQECIKRVSPQRRQFSERQQLTTTKPDHIRRSANEDVDVQEGDSPEKSLQRFAEISTSPDLILGVFETHLERYDAKRLFCTLFQEAYEQARMKALNAANHNLQKLFQYHSPSACAGSATSVAKDEEANAKQKLDYTSRAYGMLLKASGLKSEQVAKACVEIAKEKVMGTLLKLSDSSAPLQKVITDLKANPAHFHTLVRLAWDFAVRPWPVVVCQPKLLGENVDYLPKHWNNDLHPEEYELQYALPVVYRCCLGPLAHRGRVGNAPRKCVQNDKSAHPSETHNTDTGTAIW